MFTDLFSCVLEGSNSTTGFFFVQHDVQLTSDLRHKYIPKLLAVL